MNELQEVVKKMIAAGESEENIALVIKHYNKKAETKTEVPKGDEAEVVSGVSDSTSAVNDSSSELQAEPDPRFKPLQDRQEPTQEEIGGVNDYIDTLKPVEIGKDTAEGITNPELYKERKDLEAVIASRPLMSDNSKEEARLKEINDAFDRLAQPKKSLRKISNEQIAELDKQQDELTTKAVQLSKGTDFSYEEILQNDGAYQDIIKQKNILNDQKRGEEELLKRIVEDTNSDKGGFLGKVGRMFAIGDEEVTQRAKLNDAIEEEILLSLQGDNVKRGKIAKGKATLDEKEAIIANAKVNVILNEKDNIINKAKAAREEIEDPAELNRTLMNLQANYDALLGEVGFDVATGMLKNNFRKTDESQKFDNMVSSDGFFATTADMISTLGEGVAQIALKGTVGFVADSMAAFGDLFTDKDTYSVYDSFSDTVGQLTNYNFAPSSKKADTRLIGEDGDLNLTYKTITKSFAETIPFTVAIINDARRGKVTNLEVGLGKLLSGTVSPKMSQSLKLIDSAFRHTFSDNIVQAENLGLTGLDGKIYSAAMSSVEGFAEMLMPDTRFFSTTVGDNLRRAFIGDLKSAASKQARTQVAKNFITNVIGELGEEEVVLAAQDLMGYAMVVGHENSEFFNMVEQKQLAAATIIMSVPLSGANIKRDYKGNIIDFYKKVSNNINEVTENLRTELELPHHNEETKQQITNAISWANNMHKAIAYAPEGVTGEQVELLMEKEALVQEMKNLDPAFHAPIKEKIAVIDAKIEPMNAKTVATTAAAKTKQDGKRKQGEQSSRTKGTDGKNVGTSKTSETTTTTETKQGDVQAKDKKELVPYTSKEVQETTDVKSFVAAQETAMANRKEDSKQVDILDEKTAQKIVDEGGKLFMTSDGKSGGYVKKDGYMGGLFKDPTANRSQAAKVLQEARVKAGGKFFDAFGINTETEKGTTLEDIYIKNGFRPVARLAFDANQAPKGWEKTNLKERPDNVFFVYDPAYKAKVGEGQRMTEYDVAYELASSFKKGNQNTEFFTGKAAEASSKIPYKPVLKIDNNSPVAKAYDVYSAGGNFTGHISKMIAGFAEKQIKVAEAIVKGKFKSFLDIGASEGGLVKTVASLGVNKAVGIDPNTQMIANFNSTPAVKGAELRQEAFLASWTEEDGTKINEFKPKEKFEVVNEDFAFQFMNNDRKAQVEAVKDMMTPDGVFITSEKFHTANSEANEKKKYDHQSKYFNESELTEDKQTIISGMASDMVNDVEYFQVLKDNFAFVEEFWNAGDFKGYLASDSKAKLDEMKKNIGDLSSEFTDKESQTSNENLAKTEAEAEKLNNELEDFLGGNPNLQLDSATPITTADKKEALLEKATAMMEEAEANGLTEETFEVKAPKAKVEAIQIEVRENSELAKKIKKMGLKELIGKKINLVMADQLKVGNVEVGGKKMFRMGGHMFPLMDKMFGKVAWASMNETAAKKIISGAVHADYSVVYNMYPTAIDSNKAVRETFVAMVEGLDAAQQAEIYTLLKAHLNKMTIAGQTDKIRKIANEATNLHEIFVGMDNLNAKTKADIFKNILPSESVTASTPLGKALAKDGVTAEALRALNVEQFAAELPAGALTMVLEVTDKAGNKVTAETMDEAVMTPEQQKAEGIPTHPNYDIYIRGRAVAMLSETVPFWNVINGIRNSIDAKVGGIVKFSQGKPAERNFSAKEARANAMYVGQTSATSAFTVSEKKATIYENFVELLGRAFPSIEVVTDDVTFNKLIDNLLAKKLVNKTGTVYGAVYEGKLYLNSATENFNTPIHEFGHVWLNTVKEINQELYQKGISLIEGSEYEAAVLNSPEYKKVIKQMKEEGASEADIANYVAEEALATAIGDKGESFVEAAKAKRFVGWMDRLFNFVRQLTGLSKYTTEQLQDITLDEFLQGVAVDLLSGNELFQKAQVKTLTNALQLSISGQGKTLEEIVEFARDKGYEDAVIKTALAKNGYSRAEAETALATIIPKAIAKGAAEVVRNNKQGNLKADVDAVGIDFVKSTKWYKGLTTNQKNALNNKGIAEILGTMETSLRKGSQPNKEGKAFRDTVKDVTGQIDKSKTIVSTEAKLLKDKFKAMERGAKIGADEMKKLKAEFVKEISAKLKEIVNSNSMSLAEARRILSAVNQLTFKNYDRVAPLVDKVIDAIEGKGVKRQIKQAKSQLRKASRSERNPVNMRELAKESLKVNEQYLTPERREGYLDLLSQIQAAFKASSNKNYQMTNEAGMLTALEVLNREAEKAKLEAIAESMGVNGLGLTNAELIALLESENVDEHIANLKEAKQKEARTALETQSEYARMALDDVDTTDMSEQERKDIRTLKNADLSLLSSTDLRDLIKIVDNIAMNNSFASSGNLVSKVRAYTASNEALGVFNKEELSMVRKSVITDLKSLALIFKKVFMNTKKSAMFNKLSGLGKLGMAYTKHKHAMNKLSKEYDKLFSELKKKNKGLSKPENTMLRGLIGQLIQGTTAEDFTINKSRVEDHISESKNNQAQSTRLGVEVLEEQYDKLKDLKSQDEVIEYAKGLNDGNWQIVDFWLKHFEANKEALKYNTEVVHGKSFEEVVGNYLPIKMKADGTAVKDIDQQPFFDRNGLTTASASPTTIKRTKTKKLPEGRVLDLDFDSVMFNKASAVSIDIETSAAYKDVYNFFKSPNMKKMFGNETVGVFTEKLSEMRGVQLGISNMNVNEDEVTKNITKVERIWKSVATTIGLGSITQYPKQYISVAFNVMSHLGSDGGLMFKAMFTDKSKIPLLDMVSISLRGETQAGTVTGGTRISEAEKKATKALAGQIAQTTGQAADKVREALFFSLRKGDVNVAKSSWIAFYQKYLQDAGVTNIDMTTEHERMDEKLRQEAISYAELKVEETQISSDESRGSEFYQSKSVDRSILRSIFLPYQSFNINSKMRMMNDLGILGSSRASSEDKREAGASLLGTIAEVTTFQTMKYYVLGQVFMLGKSALESLFGLEAPDDDDEDAKQAFVFKQWYSALAKDINPLSIGSFAEDMSIEVLNLFQYLAEAEEDEAYSDFIKRKRDDGGQMFYRYKDKEERGQAFGASLLGGGGLYQIPYTQAAEMMDNFELINSQTRRDDYGNLYEYNFDENQQLFLQASFAVEFISMFGLGEADSRRIMRKIRRDITKNTPKQKVN